MRSRRVLAVDPFHGGSHRQFLRGVLEHSRHHWTLVSGKSVHWKWRMRSAPLELAGTAADLIQRDGYPDAVFCTDMLDLPAWRGILRDERILTTPTVVYFHENQWTYPLHDEARVDDHFGYTNLLSALSADACWFNSEFHRREFLAASRSFVRRMPDARSPHDFAGLESKSRVLPPGFVPRGVRSDPRDETGRGCEPGEALTLGWVSRWEPDKRPDRLLELLLRLEQRDVPFRLVLLGSRPRQTPRPLGEIRERFRGRIVHDGFAPTDEEYWARLGDLDVVVSTADHEFFGIAVCEAIWAGAVPVLPKRLSYPELVPAACLYDSLDHAAAIIQSLRGGARRAELCQQGRQAIAPLRVQSTVAKIDQAVDDLVQQAAAG